MGKHKISLALIFIVLIALFLRVYQLNVVPIELYGDEVDAGYQAYSILKTGQDYSGNRFPVVFQSFAEYRLPLFIYSAVPFVGIFGLNELGIRLTSVFWGIIGILGIFFLTREFFGSKIALIATFFAAISPWHLQYSRQAGIEALMLLTFITWATWVFILGLKNYRFLVLSGILFSLSIYIYATAIIFVPLYLVFLVILFKHKLKLFPISKLVLIGIIGLVILLPYLNLSLNGTTKQRFSTISIWSDQTLTDEINIKRKIEDSPNSVFFHNKPLTYFHEISGNYLKAFSLDFLFFSGDPNLRQSIGGMGQFYLFEIFTVMFGLAFFSRNRDSLNKNTYLLIGWLLLGPAAAVLTRDGGYHASRLILILVPIIIISALGFNLLLTNLRNNLVKIVFIIVLVLSVINVSVYYHKYYVDWPRESWRFWQYGYKEAITYIKDHDNEYDRIFINNTYEASLGRFLFWSKFEPESFHQQFTSIENKVNITAGFNGFKLDKYYFGTFNELQPGANVSSIIQEGDLYLVSARDEVGLDDWRIKLPSDLILLKTVVNPSSEPIFYLVSKMKI